MALNLNIPQLTLLKPKISILGVGGAGGNAINNMNKSNLEGVEFIAANTDSQALENSLAGNKIQLGVSTTRGLGAGSFPDKGREAAEENLDEINKYLEGSNMVFIAAGMGGGTGTGAAPVIAKMAREQNILTVGVVTKPFAFEGKYRMETADRGIEELKKHVDTLIVIPNQNLFRIANEHTTFESAFKMADDVLHAGVRGITDLITMPGLVNLDFADIRTIMTKMGKAMMGTGEAEGENRAVIACEAAISNPLLDDISIKGAKGVLVNMTGGPDMTLFEADIAVNTIKKEVDANANIIFGSAFNENMKGKIRISVVATGIDEDEYQREVFAKSNIEPTRFKVDVSDNSDKKLTLKSLNNQSFFDSGMALDPTSQRPRQIDQDEFRSKKHPSKTKPITDDFGFTQVSFFENELEQKLYNDDELEQKSSDKIAKHESKISAARDEIKSRTRQEPHKNSTKNPEVKKESSSFSLFSFMGIKGSKDKNPNQKHRELFESQEAYQEEQVVYRPTNAQNDDYYEQESDQQEEVVAKPKKKTAIQKPNQLFDDYPESNEKEAKNFAEQDDDIVNIPAFFRRKK